MHSVQPLLNRFQIAIRPVAVSVHNLCHLPLDNRSDRADLHTVAAVQAMLLKNVKWNIASTDAVLRAYRQAASTADTGVRDEEAFRLLPSAAEREGSPFNGFL